MMSLRYLLAALIFFSLASCAQPRLIKNSYAFTSVHMPGNIPVGLDGKPLIKVPDTVTVIYLEIKGDSTPSWSEAWMNNESYLINAQKVTMIPVQVGKGKIDNEEITISPGKGNSLWILTLSPADKKTPIPQQINEGEILLKGSQKNKTFFHKISKKVELYTPESV